MRLHRVSAVFALPLMALITVVLVAGCGGAERETARTSDGPIAFTSNRDGNVDVYVMNVDGSGQRRLTDDPAEDRFSSWSPDGKRIAFTSDRVAGANDEIFVMNADGGDEHQLTSGSVRGDFGPVWSPDGKMIAFQSHVSGASEYDQIRKRWETKSLDEVHVMSDDGSHERRLLTDPELHADGPAWSPDSGKVALVVQRGDDYANRAVYVINADGSGQRRLTDPNLHASNPTWSSDGKRIAFDGNRAVYVMNADGSGQRRLTDPQLQDAGGPVWSPDGSRIAFTKEATKSCGYWGDCRDIYVMNADGTGQRRLTRNSPLNYRNMSWSPDGTRIAFTANDVTKSCEMWVDCNYDVYAMNSDGSDQRRLTDNPKLDEGATWSPSGSTKDG